MTTLCIGSASTCATMCWHFGWMLGRRANEDRSVFAALGPGGIRFQIEMVLAAERKFAFEVAAALSPERRVNVAPSDVICFGVKTLGRDRFFDRENRRQAARIRQ